MAYTFLGGLVLLFFPFCRSAAPQCERELRRARCAIHNMRSTYFNLRMYVAAHRIPLHIQTEFIPAIDARVWTMDRMNASEDTLVLMTAMRYDAHVINVTMKNTVERFPDFFFRHPLLAALQSDTETTIDTVSRSINACERQLTRGTAPAESICVTS